MDNLCHSLVGMALSRAGLNKRTALATSTLVIANNLPDIDVGVFATNTLAMSFRRGWTHGVLAQADAADRADRRDAALRSLSTEGIARTIASMPGQILLLSYIGVLLHVFMDFTNSYGVRLLMPFSERWFYGDALYIVDPWLYLDARRWAGGSAKTATRVRRASASRWPRSTSSRCSRSNVVARREVADGLARAGRPADTRFMVTPVVVNPFRREVVIDVGDRYEKGNLWFDPLPHFRPAGFGMRKGPRSAGGAARRCSRRWRAPTSDGRGFRSSRSIRPTAACLDQRLSLRQRRPVWVVGGQASVR